MQTVKVTDIKPGVAIRAINQRYVTHLVERYREIGYQNDHPVSVTAALELWDGHHRVEAARKAGLTEIPVVIETPEDLRRAAWDRNVSAEDALPSTLVTHAEYIWEQLSQSRTQAEVAGDMRWSPSKVNNHARLQGISSDTWSLIRTAFDDAVQPGQDLAVQENRTDVRITENLLRNILPLRPGHQYGLIKDLIEGKINASKLKKAAEEYSGRYAMAELARRDLLDQSKVEEFETEIIKGAYRGLDQVRKAIEHANREYQDKHQVQVIHGDCLGAMDHVPDGSVDLLLTDPPYAILGEAWDTFESTEAYLAFSSEWLAKATAKVKPTGRVYVFWSQEHLFRFPFQAVNPTFEFGNLLVWNYRNNKKPNDQRIYKHTYEPVFYFVGKDAGHLNMPKDEEWGDQRLDVMTFATPQSNYEDRKEHPAQKPLDLIKQLIQLGSEVGDTVLDCFAGSGTTGVAAKALKRKAILIERDADFIKIINRRLIDAA